MMHIPLPLPSSWFCGGLTCTSYVGAQWRESLGTTASSISLSSTYFGANGDACLAHVILCCRSDRYRVTSDSSAMVVDGKLLEPELGLHTHHRYLSRCNTKAQKQLTVSAQHP